MLTTQVATFLVTVLICAAGIIALACLFVSLDHWTHRHLPPSDSRKP